MPQGQRIRPHAHSDGHLKPGVGDEMERWRPEQFRRAGSLLAGCRACQACLFDASGEKIGHLNNDVVIAIAEEQIDQMLPLVAAHLESCSDCSEELLNAEIALAEVAAKGDD